MKIWVVVGTRPEVIKQVPVYWACQEQFGAENVKLIGTGQHKELLMQALEHFEVKLDDNFEIMKPGQSLSKVAAGVLERFDEALDREQPDWVIVQGDTTTASMAALASFHRKIKVAHNEAGLRSHDLQNPFPEEANRKIISAICDLNFAPTDLARRSLISEGIDTTKIYVVGNSGIDSLYWTLNKPVSEFMTKLLQEIQEQKAEPVLLTAHRRENAGSTMDQWFEALKRFFSQHPELYLVYPIHPNNLARGFAEKYLKPLKNVSLLEPLSYLDTCHLLKECRFVVTDSGGIQEESATLGVPAVVCRKTTERPEGVLAGRARLVNTDHLHEEIGPALDWALNLGRGPIENLFGDGKAAGKIAQLLVRNEVDFEVLILAGGKGTRLQSIVSDVPKPLAPVAGKAFLEYLLEYVLRWKPRKIHLSVGYKRELIHQHFMKGIYGYPINVISEEEPLGTGGAVRHCLSHIEAKNLLVLNGDSIFLCNVSQLMQEFQKLDSDYMVATTRVNDCSRYGRIKFDEKTRELLEFQEKMPGEREFINTGIYAFKVDCLKNRLPEGKSSLEKDFLERNKELGLKACVYAEDAYFLDIGIPEDFVRAQYEVPTKLVARG